MALVAPGDIRSGVYAALCEHLLHIDEKINLPDNLRDIYDHMLDTIGIDKSNLKDVRQNIEMMSELEVEKIAQHIVEPNQKILAG